MNRPAGTRNPAREKQALRLWLQLLSLTTRVEKRIRRNLQNEFETTLPRFDVLATLERAGEKITMGQLSRKLLVSKGNVTGVVNELCRQGLIKRERGKADRRNHYLSLTEKGRRRFRKMAEAHRRWIAGLFSHAEPETVSALIRQLSRVKEDLRVETDEASQ